MISTDVWRRQQKQQVWEQQEGFTLFVLFCFLVVLKLKCIFPTQGRELSGPLGNESVDFTHREIDFQII